MFRIARSLLVTHLVVVAGLGVLPAIASAQEHSQSRLGGHFGVVFPIVTHVDGETVNIGDDFKIGFPMGITIKKTDKLAFDLELVPVLDPREDQPLHVPLEIHPGVLHALGHSWTGGLRMAFDVGGSSWGFTPLLNKGFPVGDHEYFVEFVVPIRFEDDGLGATHTGVTFGIHLGVGF
jgi:hypothetical protein